MDHRLEAKNHLHAAMVTVAVAVKVGSNPGLAEQVDHDLDKAIYHMMMEVDERTRGIVR